MARPKKNNADYFSHDNGMRNDPKIKALRRKYGHEGYAIWCYLLETLTEADYFEIEYNELTKELLSGDYDCTISTLESIINYLIKLGLINVENEVLTSYQLKKRFFPLLSKRKRQNKGVFDVDNPHSKVKESKVKESKEENRVKKRQLFKPPTLSEIESIFLEKIKDQSLAKLEAELFFNFYSSKNWMIGKTKMKSVAHAVGGWVARSKKQQGSHGGNQKTQEQRDNDLEQNQSRTFGVIL